jgi:4-amino-4-deoxy-L-arabinose transferase-like glycosyltransferase
MRRLFLWLNVSLISGILLFLLTCFVWGGCIDTESSCVHQDLLGKDCPVCNTVQGIYYIERFHLNEARELQGYSSRVFFFMLTMLCVGSMSLYSLNKGKSSRQVAEAELVVSFILVFLFFSVYLSQVAYIFYKMLLTGR